jgi:hypothetical protein
MPPPGISHRRNNILLLIGLVGVAFSMFCVVCQVVLVGAGWSTMVWACQSQARGPAEVAEAAKHSAAFEIPAGYEDTAIQLITDTTVVLHPPGDQPLIKRSVYGMKQAYDALAGGRRPCSLWNSAASPPPHPLWT